MLLLGLRMGDGDEYRQGGDTLLAAASGAPLARLRPTGRGEVVIVLYWSSQGQWAPIGDVGGMALPLDEASAYLAQAPIFWNWV